MSEALAKFLKEWQEKVREGKTSDLDRMERIALELYDQWLVKGGYLNDDSRYDEVEE